MTVTELRLPSWKKVLGVAALAGLGGLFGFGVATLTDGMVTRWEDEVATLMAAILIGFGLLSAGVLATRPACVPSGCGVLQVVVLLLAGAMMLVPMFGPALAEPDLVFGGVLLLLVLQSIANLMLWRAADEMLRRVMLETSALAFWVLQTALFVYAAAERLGLTGGVSAWGLLAILMSVYLMASMIASARRGLH